VTEDTLTPRREHACPLGVGRSETCLATGHHTEVGTLIGSGTSFHPVSVRLQDGIRFLRNPLPATVSSDLAACLVLPGRRIGLTLFRIGNRNREGSAISPVDLVPTCPDQAAGQPSTSRFGKGPASRFGPVSFTVFISGSLALTLRLSLAPQPAATASVTPDPRGSSVPARVATLSARSAPSRYQLRTAPRLRVVGHPVRPGLSPCQTIAATAYAVVVAPRRRPSSGCSARSSRWRVGQLPTRLQVARLGS